MAGLAHRVRQTIGRLWVHDVFHPQITSSQHGPLYRGNRLCSSDSAYVPRRACLYVPGNDEKKLAKIPGLGADCVIMDCEDGVALNRKDEARSTICKMLDTLEFGRTEPIVRVNSVDSGLAAADMDTVLEASRLPPTLMLPKVESTQHIEWINQELTTRLRSRGHTQRINLIIYVESAMAMLNLRDICQHGTNISTDNTSLIHLDGIVFGSDDFVADIGATRTSDAKELLYARQHVVLVAKAYRLHAIDLVHIDYKDLSGLREQSLEGARMGFTGKQCIHPGQVEIVHESFSPSAEKVEWAQQLVQAFTQHQQSGKGAFTFRGSMIDMPLLLQAKNILKIAESITTKS